MNAVAINFHYHTGVIGLLIAVYQRLRGVKHWRFTHVSITMSTGERIDRCVGQTLIGFSREPMQNAVILPVTTAYSNDEIAERAHLYLWANGDAWFDCTQFACSVIGYRRHTLPGALYYSVAREVLDVC